MSKSHPHIYFVAGEVSGDLLGGRLMAALKSRTDKLRFSGVGGDTMTAEGLDSFFPMRELSVMGIVEVLPKLWHLLKRINQTVDDILKKNPDVVLTIDAPDFSFRVMKKLKARGFKGKCVHYVAPSVWAWRPGRAKKISKFLDHLLCLFPFEPDLFTVHGLKADFVGHSIVEREEVTPDLMAFEKAYNIRREQRVILLLPGSRHAEVNKHAALFSEVAKKIHEKYPNVTFVIPTLTHLKAEIETYLKDTNIDYRFTEGEADKYSAFARAEMAIAASGTVTLELAYANVPMLVTYCMNYITSLFIQALVIARFASLPNVVLNRAAIPEFLFREARADNLWKSADHFLSSPDACHLQKEDFQELRENLKTDLPPSQKAAQIILGLIAE